MTKKLKIFLLLALFSAILTEQSFSLDWTELTTWTEISPGSSSDPILTYNPEFEYNNLNPGCAACPTNGGGTTDPEFKFFVKCGDTENRDNLIVVFNGGGFCFNYLTCISSFDTYTPTISESAEWLTEIENGSVPDIGGMFLNDDSNPFKGWSIIFIPYCTGDSFLGANDHDYAKPLIPPKVIQHRGAVNFQVVLQWMRDYIIYEPDNIFILGLSSGTYGALLQSPYIQNTYPGSTTHVFLDAGVKMVKSETWSVRLPESLVPAFIGKNISNLTEVDITTAIADEFPNIRFAHYTTNRDTTQVEASLISPINTKSVPGIDLFAIGWYSDIRNILRASANQSDNFKYYISAGSSHAITVFPWFYTQSSAGKPFKGWIEEMIDPTFDWNTSPSYEATSCFISTTESRL